MDQHILFTTTSLDTILSCKILTLIIFLFWPCVPNGICHYMRISAQELSKYYDNDTSKVMYTTSWLWTFSQIRALASGMLLRELTVSKSWVHCELSSGIRHDVGGILTLIKNSILAQLKNIVIRRFDYALCWPCLGTPDWSIKVPGGEKSSQMTSSFQRVFFALCREYSTRDWRLLTMTWILWLWSKHWHVLWKAECVIYCFFFINRSEGNVHSFLF